MGGILDFLGELVARTIKKPILPCKGLVRLAVKHDFPESNIEQLNYNQIVYLLKNGVKIYLAEINIDRVEDVSTELVEKLKEYQSVIDMFSL